MKEPEIKRYDPNNKDHVKRLKEFVSESKKALLDAGPIPGMGSRLETTFVSNDYPEFTMKRKVTLTQDYRRDDWINVSYDEIVLAVLKDAKKDADGWLLSSTVWEMHADGGYCNETEKHDPFVNGTIFNNHPNGLSRNKINISFARFRSFIMDEFNYLIMPVGRGFADIDGNEITSKYFDRQSNYVLTDTGVKVKNTDDISKYEFLIGYTNAARVYTNNTNRIIGSEIMHVYADDNALKALKDGSDGYISDEVACVLGRTVFYMVYSGGIVDTTFDEDEATAQRIIDDIYKARVRDMSPRIENPELSDFEGGIIETDGAYHMNLGFRGWNAHLLSTCNNIDTTIGVVANGVEDGAYFRSHSHYTNEGTEYFFDDKCSFDSNGLEWKSSWLDINVKDESDNLYIRDIYEDFLYINGQGAYLAGIWKDHISENMSKTFKDANFSHTMHMSFDLMNEEEDIQFVYKDHDGNERDCTIHCDFDYSMGIDTGIQKIVDYDTGKTVWFRRFYGGFTALADKLSVESEKWWPMNQQDGDDDAE